MSVLAFAKKHFELGIVLCTAAVFWLLGAANDIFELFHTYSRAHEAYELDEAVWAIMCFGSACLFYALRYQLQKNKEIKRRIQAEDELEWLSKHDSLTRLPNRRYLQKLKDDSCLRKFRIQIQTVRPFVF